MDKEKRESERRTAESFIKKTEIEKAFILGYMVKITQEKEAQLAAEPLVPVAK